MFEFLGSLVGEGCEGRGGRLTLCMILLSCIACEGMYCAGMVDLSSGFGGCFMQA